jgi:DNA polymerase-3 subunit delta
VLVRRVEGLKKGSLDALAEYVKDPAPEACLVLVATKIDGNSKLARAAKKAGARFDAKPLRAGAMRELAVSEARARGHVLAPAAAHTLVDAVGEDLSALDDALERLSLYVGPGQRIDVPAVEASVSRIRVDTIWQLVDAISLRDARQATHAAASLLADREPPLRILAMVSRQLRVVARMRGALASGMSGKEATRVSGAPPFKARALTEAARRFKLADLERAFTALAETDLLLKGSKEPDDVVLQRLVLDLCSRAT